MADQSPPRAPLLGAMLPATRQGFVTAFTNLRAQLTRASESTDQTERLTIAFEAIQASAQISQSLADKLAETMDDHANHVAAHVSGQAANPYSRKTLAESKCAENLRCLGSDKSEFKSWNDKLINALAQVLGKPWRTFMRNLNRVLDQDRKVLTEAELGEIQEPN